MQILNRNHRKANPETVTISSVFHGEKGSVLKMAITSDKAFINKALQPIHTNELYIYITQKIKKKAKTIELVHIK